MAESSLPTMGAAGCIHNVQPKNLREQLCSTLCCDSHWSPFGMLGKEPAVIFFHPKKVLNFVKIEEEEMIFCEISKMYHLHIMKRYL